MRMCAPRCVFVCLYSALSVFTAGLCAERKSGGLVGEEV